MLPEVTADGTGGQTEAVRIYKEAVSRPSFTKCPDTQQHTLHRDSWGDTAEETGAPLG